MAVVCGNGLKKRNIQVSTKTHWANDSKGLNVPIIRLRYCFIRLIFYDELIFFFSGRSRLIHHFGDYLIPQLIFQILLYRNRKRWISSDQYYKIFHHLGVCLWGIAHFPTIEILSNHNQYSRSWSRIYLSSIQYFSLNARIGAVEHRVEPSLSCMFAR